MMSLPRTSLICIPSSNHLYLLRVLTNLEGGGCVSKLRFPLQLGSRVVWLAGSAAIHKQAWADCVPHRTFT